MEERRKFIRLDETWPIKYKIMDKANNDQSRSRTVNVSAAGAKFHTNAILSPGDVLELELFIPADPSPVYMKGKVVWQGKVVWCKEVNTADGLPLEVGVEFINLDPFDKERLKAYIDAHLDKSKE